MCELEDFERPEEHCHLTPQGQAWPSQDPGSDDFGCGGTSGSWRIAMSLIKNASVREFYRPAPPNEAIGEKNVVGMCLRRCSDDHLLLLAMVCSRLAENGPLFALTNCHEHSSSMLWRPLGVSQSSVGREPGREFSP